jgi:hypothetical protein
VAKLAFTHSLVATCALVLVPLLAGSRSIGRANGAVESTREIGFALAGTAMLAARRDQPAAARANASWAASSKSTKRTSSTAPAWSRAAPIAIGAASSSGKP